MFLFDRILEELNEFIEKEIAGKVRYFEINHIFPERFWSYLSNELKIFNLLVDSKESEVSFKTFLELIRQLSREFASLAAIASAQAIYGIWALHTFGTLEQKLNYLPAMIAGKELAGFAFAEAERDIDKKLPMTIARQTKDGWLLTGHKHMVSNAGLARHILVYAQTIDLLGEKSKGIFIVDTRSPGVSVGEQLNKEGLQSMPLAPITFEQVQLKSDTLLGEEINGCEQYESIILRMRLVIAAQSLGIAEGVFNKGLADSKIKRGFGKRPIDVVLNQTKFAELETKLVSCAAYYTICLESNDINKRQSAILKFLTAKTAQEVSEEIIRIVGVYSFIADNDLERYVRDAQIVSHYGGSLTNLNRIIANEWL